MNVPFTASEFLANFERYNRAVWPAQIVAYAVGAAAVAGALRAGGGREKLVTAGLALFWVWTGIAYFIVFPPGGLSVPTVVFGTLFVLEGGVLIATGVVRSRLSFRVLPGPAAWIGGAFVLYAMVIYPLLGLVLGHRYPRAPSFGVAPCPVVVFTFGMLLWTERPVPKRALVVPSLWLLLGLQAAISFGMIEDFGLLVAGLLGGGWLLWRDRHRARIATPSAIEPLG